MTKENQNKSILVVEDEPELAEVYTSLLTMVGYKTSLARNGVEAVKQLADDKPDLILLDLRMPEMDGVEFLKKVDIKKKYPGVKVIVFSNYDMQDEIDEAYKYGADRYVLKAWASPKELIQIVKDTLGQ